MKLSDKADYGNWVPASMMKMIWGTTGAMLLITVCVIVFLKFPVVSAVAVIVTACMACMAIYMQRCRAIFDFRKGGMMGDVHQFLVDHFPFDKAAENLGLKDGRGQILDIGCGAAALTNRVAKTWPNVQVTGMDYWGREWSYAKEQCERNAELEGVADRVRFVKGDAAKLDFADETFDGAVSNFVFHEVQSQPDKQLVVKESLRVVKKGGAFAFQDMFGQTKLYGDMDEFLKKLQEDGTVNEIHYIPNIENQDFIPQFVTAPWMIKDAGLIYGIR